MCLSHISLTCWRSWAWERKGETSFTEAESFDNDKIDSYNWNIKCAVSEVHQCASVLQHFRVVNNGFTLCFSKALLSYKVCTYFSCSCACACAKIRHMRQSVHQYFSRESYWNPQNAGIRFPDGVSFILLWIRTVYYFLQYLIRFGVNISLSHVLWTLFSVSWPTRSCSWLLQLVDSHREFRWEKSAWYKQENNNSSVWHCFQRGHLFATRASRSAHVMHTCAQNWYKRWFRKHMGWKNSKQRYCTHQS